MTLAADVLFDFDKSVLKTEGKAKLDDLATKVNAINLEVVIAIGHTDSIGSDAYNQKLSVRRAESVKAYLVTKGVEPNRDLHGRQGREAARGEQQDQGWPRRRTAAWRSKSSARASNRAPVRRKAPLRRGFLFMAATHPNADPAELAKFGELAHRWWDPQGEFRPLHELNPLRLAWIDGLAPLAGKRVLDVGCGGGILAEAMARLGASVTGIDLSEKPLKVAELHLLESGVAVEYLRKSPPKTLQRDRPGAFDVVTCMELLEHVPDPASTVAACARLAKPGGRVFFSTINRNPKAYLFAVIGAEYLLRMLPRGTHDYARFIKPSELARWCRDAGLEPLELKGMTYNPITDQYRLGEDCERQLFAVLRERCLVRQYCSTSTARSRIPRRTSSRALNRLRSARGLETLPLEKLRPHASSGARGLIEAGLGILPEHAEFKPLREAFLAALRGATSASTRACFPASPNCLRPSRRAACAGASSPTSRPS